MKKLLTFFLTALLTFSVGWAATETDVLTYQVLGLGSSYANFTGKTATSDAVYAGNAMKSSANAIQIRSSNSNSGIVTTGSGGKVKSISVVWNSSTASGRTLNVYGKNSAYSAATDLYSTSTQGTLLGTIVCGTSTSITVTDDYEYIGFCSASGAMYLTSVSIEWETGGGSVAPPTISPASCEFAGSMQVTLTQADADAIYYTLDGSDPTTSSTLYSAPFTINATTTVKAIAVKNGVPSSTASATYTAKPSASTIAEALAITPSTTSNFTFTGSVVVTAYDGQYNMWIRDNTGSGLIYFRNNSAPALADYPVGTVLSPNWEATRIDYNGLKEFRADASTTYSPSGTTQNVEPFVRTSLTSDNMNEYVSISGLTISGITTFNNKTQYSTSEGITLYDHFEQFSNLTNGKKYDVTGVVYYNTQHTPSVKLYIISATEVVSSDPILLVFPDPLTFNDSGTGNTFTVEGSNLGTDNVGLTQSGTNFTPTLTASTGGTYYGDNYLGFTPANGSLIGTVAMSYTGRELSASETVTLANNKASTTVTVNYRSDVYILGNYGNSGWDYSNGILMTYDDTNNTYTATVTAEEGDLIVFARKLGESNPWNSRILFGPNSNGDWWVNSSPNPKDGTIDLNDDDPIYFNCAGTYTIEINATTGALTVTREVVNTGDFELVTNVNDLNAGDEVIIVNSGTAGSAKAMSTTQNDNNRGATGVTVSAAKKVTATETTQIFSLEGSSSGWYFKTVNGDNQGYIYAASSNKNYLRTKATKDDNTKASIAINSSSPNPATITFQGSYTHNLLQYNSGNDFFSCYSSAQSDVYIYKRGGTVIIEPSITVEPNSLELVIPVGGSSQSGTVTVTETNTTGNTGITINGDTNIFSATLNNGTLTVTYSGTASVSSPDEATIILTNGTATATVTVRGYKRVEATGTLYTKVTSVDQIQNGLKYILVFEGNNSISQEALNGITTGGTGATVQWVTQGSVVNIAGTDVIEFTLNGNDSEFTLSSDHGFLNPNAPGLAFGTEGTQWSAESNNGGYVMMWGDYMLRYNTGMSSPTNGRFRIYTGSTGTPVYLYVQGEETGVATPVITPASGSYDKSQLVTIECATSGATIYYTDEEGGETKTYTGPFTVVLDEDHASVTIEAWAEKDGDTSEHVTATYTYRDYGVNSIAEFLTLSEGDSAYFKNPVVVLFDYSQNSSGGQEYIWIKDRTGYTQLFIAPQFDAASIADPQYEGTYGEFVPKYENGDVIPAGFKVKKGYYNTGEYYQGQCYETHSSFQKATDKALADPEQVTLSELIANGENYNNRYLYINKLQVSNVSGLNFSIAADENGDDIAEVEGGTAVVGYNKYNSPAWKDKLGNTIGVPLPEDNRFYNVTFIFQKWQNGYEIMPIEFTPWVETSLRLEDLVEIGEENETYTISNPLIAAAVTWDDNKGKFAIFAKDDEMFANKSYPTSDMKSYRIDYQNQDGSFTNEVYQEDYDQSNWIEILIPNEGNITNKTSNPSGYLAQLDELKAQYENKILPGGSIHGQYVDALNPTIEMMTAPEVETSTTYNPNIYCTGNFLMENLDADGATSYRGDEYGGQFFMMDAKPQEFCMVVWAYFIGDDNYFVAPAREGTVINGYQFRGSFLADMSLCRETYVHQGSPVSAGFLPSDNTTPETLYGFNAIVRKNPAYWTTAPNGAPHRIQPYADGKEGTPAYIVYPLNAQESSNGSVTAVKELNGEHQVVSVRYFNVMGMESKVPFEGINIVVTRYSDGSFSTAKVLK